jgi:hypothetical protein
MAQTTEGLSFIAADVAVSADNSTWLDMTPFATSVAVEGGTRKTGEVNTLDGDTPILKSGKRESVKVTVRYVYTEDAADTGAFETLRTQYELETGPIYLRYSPKARATGVFEFTTGLAIIADFTYPQGEAESGDPVCDEFTVGCAALTKAAVGA